jgi:hypothetical protein
MEKKLKHLEFIQQAIGRMASNLFLLKGWAITLIVGLFALAAKGTDQSFYLIAFLPALMFWILDAFFLMLERRFRSLYDYVRTLDESQIDFSMNTQSFKEASGNGYMDAFWSRTLTIYYGALIVTMTVVMLVLEH